MVDQRDDFASLVTAHVMLVDQVVQQVSARFPRHVDRDDLRGAGAVGLVDAARRYDVATGVPFARYAAIRIRGEVLDASRTHDWATRRLRRDLRAMETATGELVEDLQRMPTDAEIAARMEVTADEVRQWRAAQWTVTILALDQPVRLREASCYSLAAVVAEDDAAWLPEPSMERDELVVMLRRAIAALPTDLRSVLVGHQFGGRRLREIAADLGLTEGRASQLRDEAVSAVQAYFATQFDEVRQVPEDLPGKRRRQTYIAKVLAEHPRRQRLDQRGTLRAQRIRSARSR